MPAIGMTEMTEFSRRRALSSKFKKLQEESFQLKLQVFMQESSGPSPPSFHRGDAVKSKTIRTPIFFNLWHLHNQENVVT